MKSIVVFGSTGSIGVQTLNVVRRFPQKYKVIGLAAGNNTDLLNRQIAEFKPIYVSASKECDLPQSVTGFFGNNAAEKLAEVCDADVYLMAISGLAALPPLIKIIEKGKTIGLANKEAIVCAGKSVMNLAAKYGSQIVPVDSEHSAVFQCLEKCNDKDVKKIILTASGGPFYFKKDIDLSKVTPEAALKHPTWNMGAKISIDSATMVNKGLEIIEASRLFDTENVDYIIHPESVIHSMVEMIDNSTFALMSYPNMELAIQYAMTYPDRDNNEGVKAFDFKKPLTFYEGDEVRFPATKLAKECLKTGGNAPAIYSIADEVAVDLFLKKKIKFNEICGIIEGALSINEIESNTDYEYLLELDKKIKEFFRKKYN